MKFETGQEVDWLHGDNYRFAKIIEVEPERVKLQGITRTYWMKKETLANRIRLTYRPKSIGF
ncbi:hypothetical protein [Vibrio fluvialis]|uniref:hypothetical protein n=1 Tax=Vibrio fluvialis TaxID=676 RepID=UPI0023A93A44|nr:hypothetical protein [Vibrio fluvialis]MDE5179178.1 hypothetical protein [Vibrio fluvialis]